MRGLQDLENLKFHDDGVVKVKVIPYDVAPTDPSKANPSLVIDDSDPNQAVFTKTINGVNYQKTITTSGTTTTFSSWVQI